MSIRKEIRLLRHGRDWRGRSTVPHSAEPHVLEPEGREFPTGWARTRLAVTARAGLPPDAAQAGRVEPDDDR